MTLHLDPSVIDTSTGLVKTPAGYYWRVKRDPLAEIYPYEIRLCYHLPWYRRDASVVGYYEHFATEDELLTACLTAARRGNTAQRGAAAEERLVGKYPPKWRKVT